MTVTDTDEAALLKAIIAQPEEDTPRLVYADWLQEQGQEERAEFVRVQVELARFPASDLDIRRDQLWNRRAYPAAPVGLIATLNGDYFGRLNSHRVLVYVRGFGERVECPPADWMANGDVIRERHPIKTVLLTAAPGWNSTGRGPGRLYGLIEYDPRPTVRDHRWPLWAVMSHIKHLESLNDETRPPCIALALMHLRFPGIAFHCPAPGDHE